MDYIVVCLRNYEHDYQHVYLCEKGLQGTYYQTADFGMKSSENLDRALRVRDHLNTS